jgi:hypothetical protein
MTWERLLIWGVIVPIITVLSCLVSMGTPLLEKDGWVGGLVLNFLFYAPMVIWFQGFLNSLAAVREIFYPRCKPTLQAVVRAAIFSLGLGSTVGNVFILFYGCRILLGHGDEYSVYQLKTWSLVWLGHYVGLIAYAVKRKLC